MRGIEKEETHYVNLDRGINNDAIEDFPKVSVLHLLGKPEQWREARLAAGKEIKRLAPRAKKKRAERYCGRTNYERRKGVFNRRLTLGPYITNIKTLEASQAMIREGNTNKKGTGFQTSRDPYKMTKDGKYGKQTIDVPQLVENHKLLAEEAGLVLLAEKVNFDFIDLISKRYDTKTKYSNLSNVVLKE